MFKSKKMKMAVSLLCATIVLASLSPQADVHAGVASKYGQERSYNATDEVEPLTTSGTYIKMIWPSTADKVFMPVGESITFKVNSDADTVKYAVHNGAAVTMTKTAANTFQGTWTPQESDKYDAVAEGMRHDAFRYITFSAYSSGKLIGQQQVKYSVLLYPRSHYINKFNSPSQSFKWNSPTDHPFIWGYSNVYNCISYVEGNFSSNGTVYKLDTAVELESDNYQWTQYPTSIQYENTAASGSGRSAHVVKVVEWFGSGGNKGKPKIIESKETSDEVIKIPAYITRSDGSLDFDIYKHMQPVKVLSRHSWSTTPVSIGVNGHFRPCTDSGCSETSVTEPHKLVKVKTGEYSRQKCSDNCGYQTPLVHEDHSWSPLTHTGSSGHYKECTVCGTQSDTIEHTTTTYRTSDTHSQKCSAGCGYATTPMSHTYGSWGSISSTQHKRICTHTDCGYAQTGSHSMGGWSNYSSTQHKKTCGKCEYTIYENHNWKLTYTGSSGHYKVCSVCSKRDPDTISHTTTTHRTSTTHSQKCSAGCGYETTPMSHTYGSWKSTSDTGHKRTCTHSGCGYAQTGSHRWGLLTYTGSSGHYRICADCGKRSDTISHTTTSHRTSTTHYQKCSSGCGYETTPMSHTYGAWKSTSSTQHKRTCTHYGCGYTQTGSHSGTWSNYSSTQHRKYCSTCAGYQYENHVWNYNGSQMQCSVCKRWK